MNRHHQTGRDGELYIAENIACPNCGKPLMQLPRNYPLFDVQCTGCSFRAQVKSRNARPSSKLFGAGWDVLRKVLKSGYMVPSLIAYYHWKEKDGSIRREVRFFPFIPKTHLFPYSLSPSAKQANWKMFIYVHLDKLPHLILTPKSA